METRKGNYPSGFHSLELPVSIKRFGDRLSFIRDLTFVSSKLCKSLGDKLKWKQIKLCGNFVTDVKNFNWM